MHEAAGWARSCGQKLQTTRQVVTLSLPAPAHRVVLVTTVLDPKPPPTPLPAPSRGPSGVALCYPPPQRSLHGDCQSLGGAVPPRPVPALTSPRCLQVTRSTLPPCPPGPARERGGMERGARPLLALCLAGCLLAPGKWPRGRRGALTPTQPRARGEGPAGPASSTVPAHRASRGGGRGQQDGGAQAGGGEGWESQRAPPPRSAAGGSPWPGPGAPSGGLRLHPRCSRPRPPPAPLWVPAGCRGAQGRFAYKLLHDLFANYSSALRPVEDTDRALNVTLQVTLSQIIDMVSGRARHRHRHPSPNGTFPVALLPTSQTGSALPHTGPAPPGAEAHPSKPAQTPRNQPGCPQVSSHHLKTAQTPPPPKSAQPSPK